MHTALGSWLGQTYALAKFDDAFDGKKSGIRRSKEERKGMIVTFIKRYQKSNNGDFPSLNLTRKEVGGSFYTVREIVREIIQENRVLGPPKSPRGDQNMEKLNSFLEHLPLDSMSADLHVPIVDTEETQTQPEEHHPLDSMSVDLHVPIVHTKETQTQPEEHHPSDSMSVDLHVPIVHTEETQIQPEYAFVSEKVSNSRIVTELHQGNSEAFEKSKNTKLTMEGSTWEQKDEVNEVVADETQNPQELEDVDNNLEEEIAHPLQESKSMLASQNGQEPSSTKENLGLNVNGSTDVKLEDTLLAEQKTINGANVQNHHSKTSCNAVQEPTPDEISANLNQSSDHPGASSQNRRTNSTLNRVDLKSWKAASKKSNVRETHQLVKFIRSVITAFVKFWSE